MIEVHDNLWVGTQADFVAVSAVADYPAGWAIVHACKEPHHREALGYTGRGAPKDHKEYLVARRDHRLILNMIDAPQASFIHREMIDAALAFIDEQMAAQKKVLIHCNEGRSRSPMIALLWLLPLIAGPGTGLNSFADVEQAFTMRYPPYEPGKGVQEFGRANWARYMMPDRLTCAPAQAAPADEYGEA